MHNEQPDRQIYETWRITILQRILPDVKKCWFPGTHPVHLTRDKLESLQRDYVCSPKIDGVRYMAYLFDGRVWLIDRKLCVQPLEQRVPSPFEDSLLDVELIDNQVHVLDVLFVSRSWVRALTDSPEGNGSAAVPASVAGQRHCRRAALALSALRQGCPAASQRTHRRLHLYAGEPAVQVWPRRAAAQVETGRLQHAGPGVLYQSGRAGGAG